MIEDIKIQLGEAANNFTDEQIGLALKIALAEVEDYCNREIDYSLEIIAMRIAVIKLNRMNSEGLSSQSYSGTSESYIDGYPADILAVLNRKRKIKVV
jgi:hypothetical protein